MKYGILVGMVLALGPVLLSTPAAAQSRLLGFASFGLGGEYRTGIESQRHQQVSAAREFIRAGDDRRALALLRPLQAEGFAPALTLLGSMYFIGRGVPQDDRLGAQLYAQGAKGGDPLAMYLYGVALDQGLGVRADRAAAQHWFELASDSGIAELQKAVRRYRKQATG